MWAATGCRWPVSLWPGCLGGCSACRWRRRGQTNMRGLVTAGRRCSAGAYRFSRVGRGRWGLPIGLTRVHSTRCEASGQTSRGFFRAAAVWRWFVLRWQGTSTSLPVPGRPRRSRPRAVSGVPDRRASDHAPASRSGLKSRRAAFCCRVRWLRLIPRTGKATNIQRISEPLPVKESGKMAKPAKSQWEFGELFPAEEIVPAPKSEPLPI